MSLKRKRDVADTSVAQVPFDTLLTGLKDSDLQRLQASANGILRLLSLLRKADPSVEAKKLEKHLSTQNGFPELKTALETIRQYDNPNALATLYNLSSSILNLRAYSLLQAQQSLLQVLVDSEASLFAKALLPGKNELTVAAIRLLGVMLKDVREDGWAARATKLWDGVAGDGKSLCRLLNTKIKSESKQAKRSDIRSLTLSFLLPLLSPAAPTSLKADILTLKGLTAAITKLLPGDDPIIVDAILETLYMGVYKDARLSGNLKLALMDNMTESLLEIARRKAIEQDSTTELEPDSTISAQRFLLASVPIFAPSKEGKLKFNPKIQRKIFGTFLGKLKIAENEYEAKLGLAIVRGMPELLAEFWPRFFSQMEPKATTKWIGAVSFATSVICLPSTFASTTTFTHFLDCVFPPVFTKQWISKALQHDNALVAHLVALLVLSCVQKAGFIMRNIEDQSIKSRLQASMSDRLPDIQILVALLTKSIKDEEQTDEELFLGVQTVLRLMLAYHDFSASLTSGLRFDFAKLAPRVLSSTAPNAMQAIAQTSFLQLVTSSAAAASASWSKGQGSDAPFAVLVKYSLHTTIASNQDLARQAIQRILADNLLFEYACIDEVNIWLDSVSSPETVDFLIFCIQKAIATPLRYIEQLDTDLKLPSTVAVSPLLAAWMEQIRYQANLDKRDEAKLRSLVGSTALIVLGYTTTLLDLEVGQALLRSLRGLPLDQAQIDGLDAALVVIGGQGLDTIDRLDNIPQGTTATILRSLEQKIEPDVQALSPSDRLSAARIFLVRLAKAASTGSKQSTKSATSTLQSLKPLLHFDNVAQSSSIMAALQTLFVQSSTKDSTLLPELVQTLFAERLPTLQGLAWSCCESSIELLGRTETMQRAALAAGLAPLLQCATAPQVLRMFRLVALHTSEPSEVISACLQALATNDQYMKDLTVDDLKAVSKAALQGNQHANSLLSSRLVASLPRGLLPQPTSSPASSEVLPKLPDTVVKEWLRSAAQNPQIEQINGLAASVYLYAGMSSILQDAIKQHLSASTNASLVLPVLLALLDYCEIKGQPIDQLYTAAISWTSQLTADLGYLDCEILSRFYRNGTIDHQDAIRSRLNRLVSSLTPELVKPNVFNLVAETCRNDQSDMQKNLLTQTLNKSLEILVRRFAEDGADTAAVKEMVDAINGLLKDLPIPVKLKDHLVEPVVTAAVQRRFDVSSDLTLARLLLGVSTCSDVVCYQLCQAIFAHPLLAQSTKNDSPIRLSVVQLLADLINKAGLAEKRNPPAEQIIALYHTSLSPSDLVLKNLLQRMEVSGSYSLKNVLSQCRIADTGEITDNQLLVNLSPDLVYATCLAVLGHSEWQDPIASASPYDPDFLLAGLVAYISQPDLDVRQFLKIVQNNVLGLAACGLASRNTSFRLACDRALARVRNRLQGAEFVEQEELMLVFDHIQSLCQSDKAISSPNALFLAHCLRGVGNPAEAMFVATLRHLLQRPTLEASDLPLFYQTLYAPNAEDALEQRKWLLTYLRDGLCKPDDWSSLRRRQTWELLANLFQSGFATQAERYLILQLLQRCTMQDVAVNDLVRKNGLLHWLTDIGPCSTEEGRLVVQILQQIADRLPYSKAPAAEVSAWMANVPACLAQHKGISQQVQLKTIRRILVRMAAIDMDSSSANNASNAIATCLKQIQREVHQPNFSFLVPLHDCLLRFLSLAQQQGIDSRPELLEKFQEVTGLLAGQSKDIRSIIVQ